LGWKATAARAGLIAPDGYLPPAHPPEAAGDGCKARLHGRHRTIPDYFLENHHIRVCAICRIGAAAWIGVVSCQFATASAGALPMGTFGFAGR
jgi:hypothetical protein